MSKMRVNEYERRGTKISHKNYFWEVNNNEIQKLQMKTAVEITCFFSESYLRSPIAGMNFNITEPRRSTTTLPDYAIYIEMNDEIYCRLRSKIYELMTL